MTLFDELQSLFSMVMQGKYLEMNWDFTLSVSIDISTLNKKDSSTILARRNAGGYIFQNIFHWEIWHIVIEILWLYLYISHYIWLMVKCTLFPSYNPTMLFVIYTGSYIYRSTYKTRNIATQGRKLLNKSTAFVNIQTRETKANTICCPCNL